MTYTETYPFKTKPYTHQDIGFELSKDLVEFAYFMDMGTGKSKLAIDVMCYLFSQGKIDAALIIGNNGSFRAWPEEHLPNHTWDRVRERSFVGTWKEETGDVITEQRILQIKDCLLTFCMNAEALAHQRGYDAAWEFVKNRKVLLIADESTLFKNKDAKRTKALSLIATKCAYRRIMTGDPINNSPLDIWGQCMILNPKKLRFASYYAFRAYYSDMITQSAGGRAFKKIVGYKNVEHLTNTLKTFSYRVKKEDCLDLPPKVYQKVYVEMTDEQQKLYTQIREDSIAELEQAEATATATAALAITKMIKLHQIVCGHLRDDNGIEHPVKNNRVNALLELLEEAPSKVVIWCNSVTNNYEIEAVLAAIRGEYGFDSIRSFYGKDKEGERSLTTKLFQETDQLKYIVSNKSGAFGNTWTAGQTCIYYSNGFELEIRRQSEDRLHRIGQLKSVNYVDLISKGTVDEKIIKALRSYDEVSRLVIGDKWRDWL